MPNRTFNRLNLFFNSPNLDRTKVMDRILPVRNMSIQVEVGLISGKKATVQAALDETVGTLKRRAQVALGVGTGLLLDSSGCQGAEW